MRLVYTGPVRNRIAEIRNFIASGSSIERADKVIAGLLDQADTLKDHPLRGAPEALLAKKGKGHRGLRVGRYKIIYYSSGDEIWITDFFDTKQHPSRMRG
jgi:plasmid stabilization system protein ParE